jgi:hypothetical protein
MSISAGSVVPPAVVLAVAGWSCWTIVEASAPPPAKPKPLESAAGLLDPEFGTLTERDPFALPGEPEPEAKGVAAKAKGKAEVVESPAARLRRLLTDLNARLLAARAAEARRAASRDRLAHLPLAATSVHAHRPTAIIAGRVYAQGETLEGTDPALGPVVLAEVRPRDVLLRSSVGEVVVGFPETSARSAFASRRPAAAAPAAAAKRSKPAGGAATVRGKAR